MNVREDKMTYEFGLKIILVLCVPVLFRIISRAKREHILWSGWYSLTTTNTIFEIQKRVSLINFVELEQEIHNPSKNATYFIISDLFQDKV